MLQKQPRVRCMDTVPSEDDEKDEKEDEEEEEKVKELETFLFAWAEDDDLAKQSEVVFCAAEAAGVIIESVRETTLKKDHQVNQPIWNQLDQARTKLMHAWDDMDAKIKRISVTDQKRNDSSRSKGLDEDRVREKYMDLVTEAYQNILEDIHQSEGDQVDVDLLVDCLSSGFEILTENQKEWFLSENEDGHEPDEIMTPHERRRQKFGFKNYSSSI